jgi:hypothetical protein
VEQLARELEGKKLSKMAREPHTVSHEPTSEPSKSTHATSNETPNTWSENDPVKQLQDRVRELEHENIRLEEKVNTQIELSTFYKTNAEKMRDGYKELAMQLGDVARIALGAPQERSAQGEGDNPDVTHENGAVN